MIAFQPGESGPWTALGKTGGKYRPCRNYCVENICNWMIHDGSADEYCASCLLTEIIPALNKPENKDRWYRLEQAKRRLIYSLQSLKLPIRNRREDPDHGLAFQFLEDAPGTAPVLSGHDHGLITLNVAEADNPNRESLRKALHEPYRTLLGHFRHEVGHYYWDVLITGSPLIDEFRQLFGDERRDYAEALNIHYNRGAPAEWPDRFISAYASSHPWEDWAETWAHYLHIVDGLHTAAHWGVDLRPAKAAGATVNETALKISDFETALVQQWLPLTCFLNCLNRSLGHADAYPFSIVRPVMDKLRYIHRVVSALSRR